MSLHGSHCHTHKHVNNALGLYSGYQTGTAATSSSPPVLLSSSPPILQSSSPLVLQSSSPPILQFLSSSPPIPQSSYPPVLLSSSSYPPVLQFLSFSPPVLQFLSFSPPVLQSSCTPVLLHQAKLQHCPPVLVSPLLYTISPLLTSLIRLQTCRPPVTSHGNLNMERCRISYH